MTRRFETRMQLVRDCCATYVLDVPIVGSATQDTKKAISNAKIVEDANEHWQKESILMYRLQK